MAARLGQQQGAPQLPPLNGAAQPAVFLAVGNASTVIQEAPPHPQGIAPAPAAAGRRGILSQSSPPHAALGAPSTGGPHLPSLAQALGAAPAGRDGLRGNQAPREHFGLMPTLWGGAGAASSEELAVARRRAVYDEHEWALPHPQGSSGSSSGSSSTAARESAAAGNRHLPTWLERELKAVLNDQVRISLNSF